MKFVELFIDICLQLVASHEAQDGQALAVLGLRPYFHSQMTK
jgi:hypothetical protein